ncbi:hypothetical protein SCMU_13850 [Sinomonas cyclohexanicum]|uniref:Uncharacterized protein n=1 Tax=Sinomonas cyclohexanicum TaxID=322009 RepID=A0ABM7PTH6_SINCY|nr:hypothetical protein [Corynebacterium cyclohexanicum]BCT75543.1 hypothetical protein SCMU_13850 [Corynebacterium cyclohexanicum]
MPVYRYTAAFPRHLHGLTHGVNAHHAPADGHDPAWGGTVTADTGDVISTVDPYPHPDLAELDDEDASADDASPADEGDEDDTEDPEQDTHHTETEQE